jgi:hypothetical protein
LIIKADKQNNNIEDQRSRYLAELMRVIAAASEDHPVVRCWSAPKLHHLLTRLRTDLTRQNLLPRSFLSGNAILEWLQSAGLVYPLPVTPGTSFRTEATFYVVEVGAGPASVISPFELLQAFQPAGVICYFSALSFHGLTTQTPPFHHIATLVSRPPARRPLPDKTPDQPVHRRSPRDPLGSLAFTYGATAYYSTRRYADLVAGIQTHVIDKRIQIRVTDAGQTILDTLSNPEASGGQAVIFEAWEQGWEQLRPAAIIPSLHAAGLPTIRRFAAMTRLLGLQPASEIRDFLADTQRRRASEITLPIHLFRDNSGQRLDSEWGVLVPL